MSPGFKVNVIGKRSIDQDKARFGRAGVRLLYVVFPADIGRVANSRQTAKCPLLQLLVKRLPHVGLFFNLDGVDIVVPLLVFIGDARYVIGRGAILPL